MKGMHFYRRNNSDGLLSKANTNLIRDGEGSISIDSNENLDVYHYIADVSVCHYFQSRAR